LPVRLLRFFPLPNPRDAGEAIHGVDVGICRRALPFRSYF